MPGCRRPAPQLAQAKPEQRGKRRLAQRARDGDIAHLPQVLEREMQAHAEHQEDHPQLGQLLDGLRIAHEPGRERADGDPRQQVADDGGQADAPGDHPADERHHQRHGDIDQQRYLMHRFLAFLSWSVQGVLQAGHEGHFIMGSA